MYLCMQTTLFKQSSKLDKSCTTKYENPGKNTGMYVHSYVCMYVLM